MNSLLQSDMHPDAESLNALTEQALPAAEREHVLAHVAACERCRKIVYLATDTAAAELISYSTAQVARATPPLEPPQRSWILNWRLAWIPILAISCIIVAVAVFENSREASMATHSAQIERLPLPPQAELRSPATSRSKTPQMNLPAPAVAAKQAQVAKQKEVGSAVGRVPEADKSVPQKSEPALRASAAVRQTDALQSLPAASFAGGQPQQNDALKKEDAKDLQMQTARNGAVSEQKSASESAADNAKAQGSSNMAALAPIAPHQATALASVHPPYDATGGPVSSALRKTIPVILPGGRNAISVATHKTRMVAIDASGLAFLSEDAGNQWSVIPASWTGRATVVRAIQFPFDSKANNSSADSLFELINDNAQRWTSFDGKTWVAADPIQK